MFYSTRLQTSSRETLTDDVQKLRTKSQGTARRQTRSIQIMIDSNGRRPSGILKRHGAYLEEFSLFSLEIIHNGHLQILVDDLGTILLLARLELER
jgi:hypothetical protein